MILLIDDDKFGMKPYIEELRDAGHNVQLAQDPDQALGVLKQRSGEIELIILDVLMPTGETLSESDTDAGLRTGERLLPVIMGDYDWIPVIVFSITGRGTWPKTAGVRFLSKTETLPLELVRAVASTLGS